MIPVRQLAQEFINRGISESVAVTQMKLQKMIYFAHGYHLAMYGYPLVDEPIEAWRFGPVVPNLYQIYKAWGNQPIKDYIPVPPNMFIGKVKQTIDYTWAVTKSIDAFTLSNWSHEQGSPWQTAYDNNLSAISNESIKRYFQEKLQIN